MGRKEFEAEEATQAEEAERRLVAESSEWNRRRRPKPAVRRA